MTISRPRRVLLSLTGPVLAAAVVSGCSASDITSTALDAAVGPAFQRLYLLQQHQLGQDAGRVPDGRASCSRGNPASPRRGAGADWVCVLNYPAPDGHIEPVGYEVDVTPAGCYTASGPSAVLGPQARRTPAGTTLTNPLLTFDGCFDPS